MSIISNKEFRELLREHNLQDVEANLSHTDLLLVSREFLEGWNNQRDSVHTKEWNN